MRRQGGTTCVAVEVPEVLKLAHKPPFAGHLGRDKTVNRINQRFYWPTMFADVQRVVNVKSARRLLQEGE